MATHSGVLAWRIPGTGKPGGLPSVALEKTLMLGGIWGREERGMTEAETFGPILTLRDTARAALPCPAPAC